MTRLTEIAGRVAKATEGPWYAHGPSVHAKDCLIYLTPHDPVCLKETYDRQDADAAFIAHARTDIPYLLGVVERYQRVLNAIDEGLSLDDDWLAIKTIEELQGDAAILVQRIERLEAIVKRLAKQGTGVIQPTRLEFDAIELMNVIAASDEHRDKG